MQPGNKLNHHQLLMQLLPELIHGSSDAMLLGYHDAELDLMLADAGYDVKSADLALVAQRLEQLESLCSAQDAGLISHLSSGTVHYNPSDLAGWLNSLIEGLGPRGNDGDHSAVVDDGSLHQASLQYGIENDDYWDSSTIMGYCSMDQSNSSYQLDNGAPPYVTAMPKQNDVAMTDMVQSPTDCRISPPVSQLIKDAIGHHGASSTTASGPSYATKEYSSNMMMGNGGQVGDFQQYKVVEDQVPSNKVVDFCGNQTQGGIVFTSGISSGGKDGQGQSGLSENNSSVRILPQSPVPQRAVMSCQPRSPFQDKRTCSPRHILPHMQHASHDFKPDGAAPTSSNGRVSSQGSQHGSQAELMPQEVTVKVVSSPSTMSSSPPAVPFQERLGPSKQETGYGHTTPHKLNPLCQPNVGAQQLVACADTNDEGTQEPGIRLVHLLMACAEAIQNSELAAAVDMVREIKRLASSGHGAMAKVATLFVEALARRIYGANIDDWASLSQANPLSELLYSNFYEVCPYLKFAHFTANQAILEAFKGHKFVHVIDFNLMQGLQWPALIQALALRAGGPPHLRMTGIGPPQPDNKDVLQEIGMKLAQLAGSVNVEFSFRGVVATKLDDVKPWMLEVKQGEAIAVNSILQLHRLLHGTNPKSRTLPVDKVLTSIKSLSPKIITLVEQEANHNSPVFLERFVEALHYYCTMFDSLEACYLHPQCSEMVCTEMYLGREIVNIVACEGMARTQRHEPLSQWRERMLNAGFQPLHLGSNAFKQASMLLKLFSGEGYTVEENKGCLTLGWHSRPLISASAWQCG